MRIIKNYKEDIYGNLATVYHRTNFSDLINAVYTEGFKPGEGDMYGKGFYGTYNLGSQEGQRMRDTYGNIVVKFAVSIEHFFIFDYSEFVKSPIYKKLKSTKETFLEDQAKYFNIKGNISYADVDAEFTSDNAKIFIRKTDMMRKVKGSIFTGRLDGCTLVAYDTRLVIPLSYRIDGDNDFTKVDLNKDYLRKSLQQKMSPVFPPKDEVPEWFRKAKVKDVHIEFNSKDDLLVWKTGTWVDGVWEYGLWKDGRWLNGRWKKGTWAGGTWDYGIWESGRWRYGDWVDGVWKNGEWDWGNWRGGDWENGRWHGGNWWYGTWLKGTWKGGSWNGGVWKGGDWEDGYWLSGTWERGVWYRGTWTSGTWKGGIFNTGTWVSGTWEGGKFLTGTWEDGTWKKGFWLNALWKGGVWENGTWEDGTWEGGTWKKGVWKYGRIYDKELGTYVESTVDPKTYFERKKNK